MTFLIALVTAALAGPSPGVLFLDHVEQFTLQTPSQYVWNSDRPSFAQGTLFVVAVDREVATVRQAGGAVLYVGNTPAARLNPGHLDGRIIAYVPGHVDLSKTPIFWGPSTLPERIRPSIDGQKALELAKAEPFKSADVYSWTELELSPAIALSISRSSRAFFAAACLTDSLRLF